MQKNDFGGVGDLIWNASCGIKPTGTNKKYRNKGLLSVLLWNDSIAIKLTCAS